MRDADRTGRVVKFENMRKDEKRRGEEKGKVKRKIRGSIRKKGP